MGCWPGWSCRPTTCSTAEDFERCARAPQTARAGDRRRDARGQDRARPDRRQLPVRSAPSRRSAGASAPPGRSPTPGRGRGGGPGGVNAEQMRARGRAGGPAEREDPRGRPPPSSARRSTRATATSSLEAGAGTGKTGCSSSATARPPSRRRPGSTSILAFTFTERAAGELRHRIREELSSRADRGAKRRAAATERRCARALGPRQRAGLDLDHPRLLPHGCSPPIPSPWASILAFGCIDEPEAERVASARVRRRARGAAGAMATPDRAEPGRGDADPRPRRPGPHGPRRASQPGTRAGPARAPGARPGGARSRRWRAPREPRARRPRADRGGRRNLERLAQAAALDPGCACRARPSSPSCSSAPAPRRSAGPACAAYKEAWRAAQGGAGRARRERSTTATSRSWSSSSGAATQELKEERSGLDFEDLQLEARRLLRDHPARRRHLPRALPPPDGGRVPGHQPPAARARAPAARAPRRGSSSSATSSSRSTAFATPTSRSSAASAIGSQALPKSAAEVMRLSGNFRSRPEIVAAVNAIGDAILDDFAPLTVGPAETRPKPGTASPRSSCC